MDINEEILELKCILFDHKLDADCKHILTGENHDLLAQQMVDHIHELHPGTKIDKEKLKQRVS